MTIGVRLVVAGPVSRSRLGLCGSLEGYGFDVIEAPDESSVVGLARELRADVTVMDLSMPGIGGVEATQAILDEHPGARILVLTSSADEEEVLDALLAGACGYLLKDGEVAEIVSGVRAAATDGTTISPVAPTRLLARLREQRHIDCVQAPPKPPPLTSRERDILRLLAEGRANSAIAERAPH